MAYLGIVTHNEFMRRRDEVRIQLENFRGDEFRIDEPAECHTGDSKDHNHDGLHMDSIDQRSIVTSSQTFQSIDQLRHIIRRREYLRRNTNAVAACQAFADDGKEPKILLQPQL